MAQETNFQVDTLMGIHSAGIDSFLGTPADSNILKIYGMLDRDNGDSTS